MCIFLFLLFSRTTSIGSRITALPLCTGRLGLVDFFAAQLYGAANTKNTRKEQLASFPDTATATSKTTPITRTRTHENHSPRPHEDLRSHHPWLRHQFGRKLFPGLLACDVLFYGFFSFRWLEADDARTKL